MKQSRPFLQTIKKVSVALGISACAFANAADFTFRNVTITVPDGFTAEVAAEPPLLGHPMMACFDERGRLFIAEAAGTNATIDILEKITPNFIRMVEDTDGDGKFDKSTIFADKLQIPNGALWYKGSLYVAEPPGIWKFTDTDGDGVADKREHIAARVKSNGMSSTLHGPVLGPTGRLFWCGGQGGYALDKTTTFEGRRIAPGVFTLKPDGTEHEQWSLGGYANPVEVCFSPEGEVFGTLAIHDHEEGARHDALMHWTYGGVYHTNPNDPRPLKESGPRLPPLSRVGQVAPAGIVRYRGQQFGNEFQDNVFWAQFNTHKLIRTQLTRNGATFTAKDEDFLVGDNVDFHVTDVLEDADGSLLVIDTGGWFRWGCPTSQIAKPDVRGAIYRIRKVGSPKVNDPRGVKIDWAKASPKALTELLGDARPAVQDRAIATLAEKGSSAVSQLKKSISAGNNSDAQRNAIWALSRIGSESAKSAIRTGLHHKNDSVRQSAVYAAGMERDAKSQSDLIALLSSDPQPSIRREAATALGRLTDAKAVPALLQALRGNNDTFLTHSLVYALIQINSPKLTEQGLTDSSPRVRRGALLALSKMENVQLTREQMVPLLNAEDSELQKAAFGIASKDTNWTQEVVVALQKVLRQQNLSEDKINFLTDALAEQVNNPSIQRLVADSLSEKGLSQPVRLLLLESMKQPSIKNFPDIWIKALERELKDGNVDSRLAAVGVIQERGNKRLDPLLEQLAKNDQLPPKLRIAFIGTAAPRLAQLDSALFEFLRQHLRPQATPLLRLSAARALSSAPLSDAQLQQTASMLPEIDPLALPTLLRSFNRNTNEAVGLALVAGLEKAPAAANLGADELASIIKKYPVNVQTSAKPLLQKLGADIEKQQAHIEHLLGLTSGGDFSRGKTVFFGKKAACYTCHRVSGQGGVVGPNLSKIGSIRAGRDLLESILYPSASIVQGYHPFTIDTDDDQSYAGIITRQTPEAVWIRGTDLVENRVDQKKIKSMRESSLSIMPQGLGDVLSQDELRDLLTFLQELK